MTDTLRGLCEALERLQMFRDEPGEWLVLEDQGERLVWCCPDDRQAFIDAGVPEESIRCADVN